MIAARRLAFVLLLGILLLTENVSEKRKKKKSKSTSSSTKSSSSSTSESHEENPELSWHCVKEKLFPKEISRPEEEFVEWNPDLNMFIGFGPDRGTSLRIHAEEDFVRDGLVVGRMRRMHQFFCDVPVYGTEMIQREFYGGWVTVHDKAQPQMPGQDHYIPHSQQFFGNKVSNLHLNLEPVDPKSYDPPERVLEQMQERYIQEHRDNCVTEDPSGLPIFSQGKAELIVYMDSSQPRRPDDRHSAKAIPRVAYMVEFLVEDKAHGKMSKPRYIVEARTKKVIEEIDVLKRQVVENTGTGPGGNEKTGKYEYGVDKPNLEITVIRDEGVDPICVLENDKVKTIKKTDDTQNAKANAHSFPCFRQVGDGVNGAYSPLNDAHFFATTVADFFNNTYESVKPPLEPIIVIAHDTEDPLNGGWNGDYIHLGVGDKSKYYPFTTLDIVAHEIGHGVTDQFSDLQYIEQSGALSESFSDMTAKALESYVSGDWARGIVGKVHFNIGRNLLKDTDRVGRCLDDPKCDGKSIDHVDDYFTGIDKHESSGVFNKVFYEMAQRFKYGVWDAYDLFYTTNRHFWGPETGFVDGATLVMQALKEMREGKHRWSYPHLKETDAIEAFRIVGIHCENFKCT